MLAPLFIVFYDLHALGQGWLLLVVMPLGTWALVCNGTFFAALGLRTRNRELLLPLILFPISIPALLGDDAGHNRDPYRRIRSRHLDPPASGLQHRLHHGMPATL